MHIGSSGLVSPLPKEMDMLYALAIATQHLMMLNHFLL